MLLVTTARRAALALAASLALAFSVFGPAMAQTYDGDWAGALSAGGQTLRLVLHVTTKDGATAATIDSLDQGATIPATAVKTDGGELSVLFMAIGGELTGKLSADGKTLTGTWAQGATVPLVLTKTAPK
jgi:hypothetical protein